MYCVIEYGNHIGTLRNFFARKKDAFKFANRIIGFKNGGYQRIDRDRWYCREKEEFIRITKT